MNSVKNIINKVFGNLWYVIIFAFVGSFLLSMVIDLFFSDYINRSLATLIFTFVILLLAFVVRREQKR